MLAPHLSHDEAARWERLELEHAFARMADVVFCRRCGTPCLEDKDNCAICSGCYFVFCSLCQESWHPGSQVGRNAIVAVGCAVINCAGTG